MPPSAICLVHSPSCWRMVRPISGSSSVTALRSAACCSAGSAASASAFTMMSELK